MRKVRVSEKGSWMRLWTSADWREVIRNDGASEVKRWQETGLQMPPLRTSQEAPYLSPGVRSNPTYSRNTGPGHLEFLVSVLLLPGESSFCSWWHRNWLTKSRPRKLSYRCFRCFLLWLSRGWIHATNWFVTPGCHRMFVVLTWDWSSWTRSRAWNQCPVESKAMDWAKRLTITKQSA